MKIFHLLFYYTIISCLVCCSSDSSDKIPDNPADRAEILNTSISYLTKYTQTHPTHAHSHYTIASLYYEINNIDAAYFAIKKAINLQKNVPDKYYLLMVNILLKKSFYKDAGDYFAKIISSTQIPENELNETAFELYYKTKNYKKAGVLAERLTANNISQTFDIDEKRAQLKLNSGDTSGAINIYMKLLKQNKKDLKIMTQTATLYYLTGKPDSTLSIINTYTDSTCTNATLMYLAGQCHKTSQNKDTALLYFEKCIAIDSLQKDCIYALGIIYLQSDKYALANRYFLKYRTLDSLRPNLNFKIATCYKKQHKKTLALKYFAMIDSTDINYKFARQSIKNLTAAPKIIISDTTQSP
ncbi:MAG: hypothetical protein NW207_06955 [Cytophagales bacterium]|nr:hypothetical protein [Cytophagales bacterium]